MFDSELSRRAFGKSVFATSLLGLMAAAGCTSEGQNDPAATPGGATATVKGGTLTIAVDGDLTSFYPPKVSSGGSFIMAWQPLYDPMLRFNEDGTITPSAAKEFTANADNTKFTLKLHEGMTFTDGEAFNAAAFKLSVEKMKTGGGSDASRVADWTVTTPDDLTVEITTPKPNGLVPMFLCLSTGLTCSPKAHDLADKDQNPIGSGPYKMSKEGTTTGSVYTFVRNEKYRDPDAYPYDKVVIKYMQEISARLNAIKSGQLNATILSAQTVKDAEASGLTIIRSTPNWMGLILFDRGGKTIPALGNLKVRQAINHAFDRESIVKNLLMGEGKVAHQIFDEGSAAYRADAVDMYPYDIEKAKALMKEAGFEAGFTVDMPVFNPADPSVAMTVTQLKKLNITANMKPIAGFQGFMDILMGKYPMMVMTLESRTALWDVVQGVKSDAIWNSMKAADPELTALCDQALLEGDKGTEVYQKIGKFLMDNAWFGVWARPNNIFAVDKKTTAEATLGSAYPYLVTYAQKA